MIANAAALPEFFTRYRDRSEPLVLATIVETIGSTYRKPAAQMLIARDGQAAGLLSGGCAESDLIERAARVFASGQAEIAVFDTRGSDDVIWGIGLGCEGAMKILLSRIDAETDYAPYSFIHASKSQHARGAFALTIGTTDVKRPLGYSRLSSDSQLDEPIRDAMSDAISRRAFLTLTHGKEQVFVAPIELPPRLLVLGAGADAAPVVELAGLLGWQVTITDHRPAYSIAERFPRARHVLLGPAKELAQRLAINDYDAAVVMSHHLPTDQIYLEALAQSTIRYVGLLGPANRRQRLLSEVGAQADALRGRLAGPVGLDIGAQTPEAIALAIVAEIHTFLMGRSGSSFSGLLKHLPNDEK